MPFGLLQEGLQQNVKNMEARYFHVLTFSSTFHRILLWIQGLKSSFAAPYLLINFDWLSFEKIEKNNVSSNLCVLNLHTGKDITSHILNIVSNNLCRQ